VTEAVQDVVQMGTKAELIQKEDDFPDVLCEVIDRLELKPVVLSGADVLHAAPNVIFMGSMARQTDVFSDPNQQNVHLVHARNTLIRQIQQGDCLSGFEFVTRPNFSAMTFSDDEESHSSRTSQIMQIGTESELHPIREPVSAVAPQMHAVMYSSPCAHVQSAQELEMEPHTAKLLKVRGLGNPVAAVLNFRGASLHGAKVNTNVQGLLSMKIEWLEGEGLMAGNQEGTSDPYVVFDSAVLFHKGAASKFGLVPRSDMKKFQTSVKIRTLNPKWTSKDCPELPTALSDLKGLRAHELVLICYSKHKLSFNDMLGQLRLPLKGLPKLVFDEPLLLGGCHMGRLKGKITISMQTKPEAIGALPDLHKDRKNKQLWRAGQSAMLASRFFAGTSKLKPVSSAGSIMDLEKGTGTPTESSGHAQNKPSAFRINRVFAGPDGSRSRVTFGSFNSDQSHTG